jgi:hypothetical protein
LPFSRFSSAFASAPFLSFSVCFCLFLPQLNPL